MASLLSLLVEGNFNPTCANIAARAAVSRRSAYLHFEGRIGLLTAAVEHHFKAAGAAGPDDPDGPFPERLAQFLGAAVGVQGMTLGLYVSALFIGDVDGLQDQIRERGFDTTLAMIDRYFARELRSMRDDDAVALAWEIATIVLASSSPTAASCRPW